MKKHQVALALTLAGLPVIALANVGVPMLFVVMPALAYSIIPIILIEAYYLSNKLQLPLPEALKLSGIMNIFSTIIGIPLTWFILVLMQMLLGGGGALGLDTTSGKILSVTFQAAWLIPYESELHWMIPVAGTVLIVPFFFASWFSEFWIATKRLRNHPKSALKTAIRNANLITYTLLTAWPIWFWLLNN